MYIYFWIFNLYIEAHAKTEDEQMKNNKVFSMLRVCVLIYICVDVLIIFCFSFFFSFSLVCFVFSFRFFFLRFLFYWDYSFWFFKICESLCAEKVYECMCVCVRLLKQMVFALHSLYLEVTFIVLNNLILFIIGACECVQEYEWYTYIYMYVWKSK